MSFQLAYPKGMAVPRIVTKALAASQAESAGALYIADGSDNFAACGADPAAIAGVGLFGCGADTSGFNILGKKEFPPGYMECYALTAEIAFSAKYVGSLPGVNGGSYGVVRDSDGLWKIDFAEVTTTQFKLVDRRTTSPENIARVIVVPLVARIQLI